MTQQQFIQDIENTFRECLKIVKMKNADYANSENPFRNFESTNIIGVDTKHGIMVRIMDKITRIANLLGKEPEVANEKITDSIEDCINYLSILKANIKNDLDNK